MVGSKIINVRITPTMKAMKSQTIKGPSKVKSENPGKSLRLTGSVLLKAKSKTIEKIIILETHIKILIG
jgi:hypothetical protein